MIPAESIGDGLVWTVLGLGIAGVWLGLAVACFWIAWTKREK